MSDDTPTPDGAETTVHDPDEPADSDWEQNTEAVRNLESRTDKDDGMKAIDRKPRRVELELPDELGVYDSIRHRNGDETFLFLSSFGDGYQALAYDINAGGEILETEIVGHAETEDRAVGMCEYWLQANPDGVLGATEAPGGSGGIVDKLGGMFGGLGE